MNRSMDEKVRKSIFYLFDENTEFFKSVTSDLEFKVDTGNSKKEQLGSLKICTYFFLENVELEREADFEEIDKKLLVILKRLLSLQIGLITYNF
jgi:hypothetical protein